MEQTKERGFRGIVKDGLSYLSQAISSRFIDERMARVEKRIVRKVYSILTLGIGGILLIFALFFYIKEFLYLSNTIAFFSIGIIIFVIGLMLKLGESNR